MFGGIEVNFLMIISMTTLVLADFSGSIQKTYPYYFLTDITGEDFRIEKSLASSKRIPEFSQPIPVDMAVILNLT